MGFTSLFVLIISAIGFAAGGILFSRFIEKGSTNPQKGQPYECGIPSDGSPWKQFNIGYYLYAIVFLIFDVELVFLYPWAVVAKKTGMPALAEISIFLGVLFLGFIYAHKKGALKWL